MGSVRAVPLFRHSRSDPDDGQAYFMYAAQRQACALETLVRVAGTRWCIERAFEDAKQEAGLDEYEVRSATGWYRHMTLALWALDLLVMLRATTLPDATPPGKKSLAAAWRPSNGPAGWGRVELGGRPPAAGGLVAMPRARPAPLAGLEAQPCLDGPVLPLPKTRTANYSTTVVIVVAREQGPKVLLVGLQRGLEVQQVVAGQLRCRGEGGGHGGTPWTEPNPCNLPLTSRCSVRPGQATATVVAIPP